MTLDRIITQKERQLLPVLSEWYKQEYESQAIQKYGSSQRGAEWVGEKRDKNIEINGDIKTLSFSKPTNKYLWQSEINHCFTVEEFNSSRHPWLHSWLLNTETSHIQTILPSRNYSHLYARAMCFKVRKGYEKCPPGQIHPQLVYINKVLLKHSLVVFFKALSITTFVLYW